MKMNKQIVRESIGNSALFIVLLYFTQLIGYRLCSWFQDRFIFIILMDNRSYYHVQFYNYITSMPLAIVLFVSGLVLGYRLIKTKYSDIIFITFFILYYFYVIVVPSLSLQPSSRFLATWPYTQTIPLGIIFYYLGIRTANILTGKRISRTLGTCAYHQLNQLNGRQG